MPPRPNLNATTTQELVLHFYRDYVEAHGVPPSAALMVSELKLGRSTVYSCLDALEAKGYLKKKPITIKRLMPVKRRTP